MRAQTVPAALIVATLLVGAQSPAAAGAAQCGGFVRQVASGDVEVPVRGQRVEVRLRDAEGVAAVAVEGEAEQIRLHRVSPGFLVGDASGPITTQIIRLRLASEDGAIGAARIRFVAPHARPRLVNRHNPGEGRTIHVAHRTPRRAATLRGGSET